MTTAAMAVAASTPASMGGGFMSVSLYVGDLDHNVVEAQLYDLFSQAGTVVSVRVCRDLNKRSSLGYAYVNYSTPQEAVRAKEMFNYTPVNGKPIRIMFSQRDPSTRKTGYANVFIKNLDPAIDNKALHETFAAFGTVLSCKVATDINGQSKGFGYVQFENDGAAQNAIKRLNGMLINDKQVYVGQHIRRQERMPANASPKFNNVYVKNLSETTIDEDLEKIFGTYGTITSAVVMKDQNGKSKCFGFVNFQSSDAAATAVENLNGTKNDDKVLYVGRAQRKPEREAELRAKYEQEKISRYEKLQAANLYLKNLDDSIDEEKLNELFSEFGTITSCKVILDPQGMSKGSGFVAFSTPEEASKALEETNGKMVGKKPLYVAVAQRKEERKARLQAYFTQLRPGPVSPLASGMPGFHPAAHRLGPQQLYYGQGGPGLIHPQPTGYGFQQQLLPAIRPGVTSNYIMPYNLQRQGQPNQRMGFRRGGNTHQMQQQQMIHRNTNQGFRYMGNARDSMDPPTVPQNIVGPIMPLPFEVSRMPVNPIDVQRNEQMSISSIISSLASCTPETRNEILGEQLYPLVQRIEPEHVSKVTGMLLEMDQAEVLHLIESPGALKEKIAEAMAVLRNSAAVESDIVKLGVN